MTLYAIGDIQGCYRAFETLLEKIAFDAAHDRLWLVGDLVNRGPDSLAVLRRVVGLGDAVTAVLGNHDLHLLAAAAGVRRPAPRDTLAQVLEAPDAESLLDWLRRRPLLHYDEDAGRVLVHAGVPPVWSLEEARSRADEVEQALRGNAWRDALADMYGDVPEQWSPDLPEPERMRYTINGLTRMRYCRPDGRLELSETGPPGTQPEDLMPWFDMPGRPTAGVHIVFGHWAALGVLRRADLTALDSGCVWGRALTAVALDENREPIAVDCPPAATPKG